ncbi:outer membrane beta-barrel family protein [Pedobacter sp. PLR]|uniref:outer membrane beta-barrel family protein n=1 Tax=Pedobacter sp. PLR TaxID=2994465 RepID=UPI0022483C1C|nr:outer membrane beta-barrel family protein [Pedobacter sp. PLR]MCX2449691.1 outer membrane beta-barrel family protein [Pedobacter sp. PLR]
MITLHKHLLISLLLLGSATLHAQTKAPAYQIKGKVLDENQQELIYALVNLYQSKDSALVTGTLTNEQGEFNFLKALEGSYLIEVESMGYQKKFHGPFLVNTSHQMITITNIAMQPETKQLNAVTIFAKKPLIERKNGKVILNVASSTIASGNTAMEILSKAPGVTADNEGNFSLRGKAGVNIMIDGKLTYLSTAQLSHLLRATPGSSIQNIEIISNPTAKYDAAGTGGIININLKKNSSYGTNGNFQIGGGYGTFYKSDVGISLNHRSKKVNIFGNYNYGNNKEYEDLFVKRSTKAQESLTYFDQEAKQNYFKRNNTYKAGIDYYLNDHQIIGFMASGYVNNNKTTDLILTKIGAHPGTTDSTVLGDNPGKSTFRNQSYNLNYKAVLDTSGQEFNADIDYSRIKNTEQTTYQSQFTDANGTAFKSPLIFRNSTPAKINIFAAKLDYAYPFNPELKLETGLKSSYVNTDNDFQSAELQDNSWINDPTKSNRFTYKESINAAYAALHKTFEGGTNVQIGLRTELTHSEGNSITLQNLLKRSYLDFFPNFAINHSLSKDHDLGFSYSRRIDRPGYQSLNPFIYYADLYTLSQGNPALKPEYANALELTYGYQKKTNFALAYTKTKDVIATTLLTDTIKKTLLLYEQNLASRSTISFNINRPVVLTNWWSTNNDVTLYYSRFSSPELMGAPFKNGKTTFILNTTQTFLINKTLNAELAANYTSGQAYGTYIAKPIYGIDLGISKSFASERANLKFAINDVFNTREIKINSAIPLQDYRLSQKQESRIFRLTFNYNFGSTVIKPARERSNSSELEQNRVKSGN